MKIRPTWETLNQLETAVVSDESLNVGDKRCSKCKSEERERLKREEENLRQVFSMLKRMDQSGSSMSFCHWTEDKFGRAMYPHVRKAVFANATILSSLGFVQARQKPYLFLYKLPKGAVFANFGSTEEVPIWEDTSALIHISSNSVPPECGECDACEHGHTECCWPCFEQASIKDPLIQGVLDRCRAAGAKVRVSFYERNYDDAH